MDFNRRVVVDTQALAWVASPMAGVERRMLERAGAESGHATTIVRYAPGSSFRRHVHDGGEEFLVLEGTFSDETGDFPAGTYVRNPPGSSHAPRSDGGCTILVKLCQMGPEDTAQVVVNTQTGQWQDTGPGKPQRMPLYSLEGGEKVALARFAPGDRIENDLHDHGEEVYVLDGVLEDEQGRYPAGTWLRQPDGSSHSPFSTQGCTLWVKRGHLGG